MKNKLSLQINNIKTKLHEPADFTIIYRYYTVIMLTIFSTFPLLNLIRVQFTTFSMYYDWRDFMFIFAIGALPAFGYKIHVLRKRDRNIVKNVIRKNWGLLFFAALAVWMIIAVAVTGFTEASVVGKEWSRRGLLSCLMYLVYLFGSLNFGNEKQKRWWILYTVIIAGIINILIIMDQYLFNDAIGICYGDLIFFNRNHLGYYTMVTTVMALMMYLLFPKRKLRITGMIFYVLGVMSLIINDTLGCLVSLVLTVPFVVLVLGLTGKAVWKRVFISIGVTAAVFAVMLLGPQFGAHNTNSILTDNAEILEDSVEKMEDPENVPDSLGSGRMRLWKTALKNIKESPIFGKGTGEIERQLEELTDGSQTSIHNEFLEYAANYGIPALLLYLAGVFYIFIKGLLNRKKLTVMNITGLCVAFAYLVSSVFGVSIFYTTPFLFLSLGLGCYNVGVTIDTSI